MSTKINDTKIILKNFASGTPKSRSDRKNKNTASINKGKYAIHARARIADIQKGIKSTDHNNIIEAEILNSIGITYITLKQAWTPDRCNFRE